MEGTNQALWETQQLNQALAETQQRVITLGNQSLVVQNSVSQALGRVRGQVRQLGNTLVPVANVGLNLFGKLLSLLQPVATGNLGEVLRLGRQQKEETAAAEIASLNNSYCYSKYSYKTLFFLFKYMFFCNKKFKHICSFMYFNFCADNFIIFLYKYSIIHLFNCKEIKKIK